MKPVVFTGAPGTGKTALLQAMAAQGHRVVHESAREIIRARREQGLEPRPSPAEFARELLRMDARKYEMAAREPGLVFFDRGVVDALGMVDEAAPLARHEIDDYLSRYPYGPGVFFFPVWEAIYANDSERDQTLAQARDVEARLLAWYRRCGYRILELPRVSIAERRLFVLDSLRPRGA
jgi:predicted ATPase